MARQSLSNMLGDGGGSLHAVPKSTADTARRAPEPTPTQRAEPRSRPTPTAAPRTSGAKKTPAQQTKHTPAADEPKYLTLQRKEARLTDEQLDELTSLTRRLNKLRKGAGERITDNTLIRVAVDLLLQDTGRLTGTTEDELRRSVGL